MIMVPVRSSHNSDSNGEICEGFFGQGFITNMEEEKSPSLTHWPIEVQIMTILFLIHEVQSLCKMAFELMIAEERIKDNSIVHLSLLPPAVQNHFYSMSTRLKNIKRKCEALRVPYQPLIILHGYANCSLWSFHPGWISSTFSNSPPWSFSFRYSLSLVSHHVKITLHAFIFLSLAAVCQLSTSSTSLFLEADALLKDASALITGFPFAGRFPRTS